MIDDGGEVRVLRRHCQMRGAERSPAVAVTTPAIDIPAPDLRLSLDTEILEAATFRCEVVFELVDGFLGGIVGRHDREPALTEARRAPKQGIDATSEPYRYLATGKRIDTRLRDRVKLAPKCQ